MFRGLRYVVLESKARSIQSKTKCNKWFEDMLLELNFSLIYSDFKLLFFLSERNRNDVLILLKTRYSCQHRWRCNVPLIFCNYATARRCFGTLERLSPVLVFRKISEKSSGTFFKINFRTITNRVPRNTLTWSQMPNHYSLKLPTVLSIPYLIQTLSSVLKIRK